MIYFRIFLESLNFAWHSLVVNKLRTSLSLLGITIGIFTIVAVFTAVGSLERSIRGSFEKLGSNVVYVQRWPWGGGGGEWWKLIQRPEPTYREMQMLEKKLNKTERIAFGFGLNKTAKYRENSVESATLMPVSFEYFDIWGYDLDAGRYFSSHEAQSGRPICVIGNDVAVGLFPNGDALGREIKVMGRKLTVVGLLAKEGKSLIGGGTDGNIFIPVNYARKLMNADEYSNAFIMAVAKPGVGLDELKDELEGAMRSIRKLKPKAENNFALNEVTAVSSMLDTFFAALAQIGSVIGGFSILVGGFGIANIMFVSVKERTNQIGIQKSLGAKNYFILMQFLFESIMLSVFGGLLGVALVFIVVTLVQNFTDYYFSMSFGNFMLGIGLSTIIGIVSGFLPARAASRLDPVEAIRSGM